MPDAHACKTEIEELHRFFVDWFCADTDPAADDSRFADVLAPEFLLISPGGVARDRTATIDLIRAARGSAHGQDFAIWIERFDTRLLTDDLTLVTYEEHQRRNGKATVRLSTALFRRRPESPNGVEWLHVHETWLPASQPDAT